MGKLGTVNRIAFRTAALIINLVFSTLLSGHPHAAGSFYGAFLHRETRGDFKHRKTSVSFIYGHRKE